MTFWDAIEVGMERSLGTYTFTPEAIVAFAEKYDPQRFHLSEDGARGSIFGALCASGWHTASVWMRLNILNGPVEWKRATGIAPPPFGPSPGMNEIRWLRPVYSGETVRFGSRVTDKRESRSRPGWGIVTSDGTGALEDGTMVLTMNAAVLVPTR